MCVCISAYLSLYIGFSLLFDKNILPYSYSQDRHNSVEHKEICIIPMIWSLL